MKFSSLFFMAKPIVLLADHYSTAETRLHNGFLGAPGLELLRMLDEAGVISLTTSDLDYIRRYWSNTDPQMLDMVWRLHPEVQRLHVFPFTPPENNEENLCGPKSTAIPGYSNLFKGANGFVQSKHAQHLHTLRDRLNRFDPNVVVALGNTALWSLCGTTGVSKLRGTVRLSTHTVGDFKVLITNHPNTVLRQYELRPITIIDLMKATRENASPELLLPRREIWIEPTLEDIRYFHEHHIRGCDLLSVDIETAGNSVTCIGFAPSRELAIVVPFYDDRKPNRSYWPSLSDERSCWEIVRNILLDRTILKLFQNGMYDIAFLWRSMGLKTYGAAEDTMLLHHALQPESKKSLGLLGSLYTNETAWKNEHKDQVKSNKRDA